MGVFEFPNFAKGTSAVAEACAQCEGTTIIGGGASLEFLEGKVLPGVAVLNDK